MPDEPNKPPSNPNGVKAQLGAYPPLPADEVRRLVGLTPAQPAVLPAPPPLWSQPRLP